VLQLFQAVVNASDISVRYKKYLLTTTIVINKQKNYWFSRKTNQSVSQWLIRLSISYKIYQRRPSP